LAEHRRRRFCFYKSFATRTGKSPGHIKTQTKGTGTGTGLLKGSAADPKALPVQPQRASFRPRCLVRRIATLCQRDWRAKSAQSKARRCRRQLQRLCRTPLCYPKVKASANASGSGAKTLLYLLPSPTFRRPIIPPSGDCVRYDQPQKCSRHPLGQKAWKNTACAKLFGTRSQ